MAGGGIARAATIADAERITAIYNQGIEDRIATFETELRTVETVRSWFSQPYPIVVVERDGMVVAWANASAYRPRACYARVCEFSVYVDRDARGTGAGRMAMEELIRQARDAGYTKLLSRVFVENSGSRSLLRKVGFREVGVYHRHGQLDGQWRDCVIVEYLLDGNTWHGLHNGQVIKVAKTSVDNAVPPVVYPGTVVPSDVPDWIAIEAVWTMADTNVDGVLFEQGGRLLEYFSTTQPYNIFHVFGRDGASYGLYGNVTAPARIESDTGGVILVWEDHWLDVVKLPDGRILTLDEDEVPTGALSPEQLVGLQQAHEALRAAIESELFG